MYPAKLTIDDLRMSPKPNLVTLDVGSVVNGSGNGQNRLLMMDKPLLPTMKKQKESVSTAMSKDDLDSAYQPSEKKMQCRHCLRYYYPLSMKKCPSSQESYGSSKGEKKNFLLKCINTLTCFSCANSLMYHCIERPSGCGCMPGRCRASDADYSYGDEDLDYDVKTATTNTVDGSIESEMSKISRLSKSLDGDAALVAGGHSMVASCGGIGGDTDDRVSHRDHRSSGSRFLAYICCLSPSSLKSSSECSYSSSYTLTPPTSSSNTCSTISYTSASSNGTGRPLMMGYHNNNNTVDHSHHHLGLPAGMDKNKSSVSESKCLKKGSRSRSNSSKMSDPCCGEAKTSRSGASRWFNKRCISWALLSILMPCLLCYPPLKSGYKMATKRKRMCCVFCNINHFPHHSVNHLHHPQHPVPLHHELTLDEKIASISRD